MKSKSHKSSVFVSTLLICTIFAITACSSSRKIAYQPAPIPQADQALVYVLRPSSLGTIVKMDVYTDGTYWGSTHGKRYLFAYLKPGPHQFESRAENKAQLDLVLEGGKTYYLEQQVKMGLLKARNKLNRIFETSEAEKKLRKCKLVQEQSR